MVKMAKVQPLRIEDNLMKVVELKSVDEHIPKTTAIRQLLYNGAEEYLLRLCSIGRVSIGKAAEMLHKSIYDLQESAQRRGIEIGITAREYNEGKKFMEELL